VQQQYNGTAMPVASAQSRRLDLALQHIHEGCVTFPVLRASHLSAVSESAGLSIDYTGIKVHTPRPSHHHLITLAHTLSQ
jgi:hypothetical protein